MLAVDKGEGVGHGEWGGASMMIRPEKGLRSVHSVLCSSSLNDILVSFVIIMLTNELFPLVLSHPCFRCLRSLHLFPWYITSL